MEQLRMPPGNNSIKVTGGWCYYIRPDGATIRDALILYPNGGVPDIDDQRMKARYGTNSDYYKARQERKGLEYIGPSLTEGGIQRLVQVLERNREDEILFMEDEIADAQDVAKTSDLPDVRNQAKRRVRQLTRRLELLKQPLDADAMEAELKDIARAQSLARVDPNVLRTMRAMLGELDEKLTAKIAFFQQGKSAGDGSVKLSATGATNGSEFEGKDNLSA